MNAIAPPEADRWLLNALAAVFKLRELAADWDGGGSPPVREEALAGAVRLLCALPSEELPPPHVCPVSGRGIQLEWQLSGRELELEVLPDGSVEFLKVDGDWMDEGALGRDDLLHARALADWLRQA